MVKVWKKICLSICMFLLLFGVTVSAAEPGNKNPYDNPQNFAAVENGWIRTISSTSPFSSYFLYSNASFAASIIPIAHHTFFFCKANHALPFLLQHFYALSSACAPIVNHLTCNYKFFLWCEVLRVFPDQRQILQIHHLPEYRLLFPEHFRRIRDRTPFHRLQCRKILFLLPVKPFQKKKRCIFVLF